MDDRVYYPTWNEIKLRGTAKVVAPKPLHGRIIKAITKEKWMDMGFKLELAEREEIAVVNFKREFATITFTLVIKKQRDVDFRRLMFSNKPSKRKFNDPEKL